MKKAIILFVNILCLNLFSQENIKWGETEQAKGDEVSQIIPMSNSDYYTLSGGKKAFLNYYKNNLLIAKKDITSQYHFIKKIDNSIYLFLAKTVEGSTKSAFYVQKYDENCNVTGNPIILDYPDKGTKDNLVVKVYEGGTIKPFERANGRPELLHIIQSENLDYFAFEYFIKNGENEKNIYTVYDKNFKKVGTGENEIPYQTKKIAFTKSYLSNDGDYYLTYKINKTTGNKNEIEQNKVFICKMSENTMDENKIEIDLSEDEEIADLLFSVDHEKNLSIVGVFGYCQERKSGTTGVFNLKINTKTKVVVQKNIERLTPQFMTEEWSDDQKRKYNQEKVNYKVEKMITLSNGSFIGIFEDQEMYSFYSPGINRSSPAIGASQYATDIASSGGTYKHFHDIIIYKVNNLGKMEWMNKITKMQETDYSNSMSYGSFSSFLNNDKLVFFYNDESVNFDNGSRNNKNKYCYTTASPGSILLIKVSIDLKTGKSEQSIVLESSSLKLIPKPKMFTYDALSKSITIILDYKNSRKFGSFTL